MNRYYAFLYYHSENINRREKLSNLLILEFKLTESEAKDVIKEWLKQDKPRS